LNGYLKRGEEYIFRVIPVYFFVEEERIYLERNLTRSV